MKLEGISLYVEKTLIIGVGDIVKNCDIGGASGLDALISIPKETVESEDYEVSGNDIKVGFHRPKREYAFVYRGYDRKYRK